LLEQEVQVLQIVFLVVQLLTQAEEVEEVNLELQEQVDQAGVEQEVDQVQVLMELQEQLILGVEVEEEVQVQIQLLAEQVDQESLLLEHQEVLEFQYHQAQIQ
jgi:hypothetical protein